MTNAWQAWAWQLIAEAPSTEVVQTLTEQLQNWLMSNPIISLFITVFVVITGVITAIVRLTDALSKLIEDIKKNAKFVRHCFIPKEEEVTNEEQQKFRQDLIEIVLEQVIKQLEDSLHHKIQLDLRREEQNQRVGQANLSLSKKNNLNEEKFSAKALFHRALQLLHKGTPPESVDNQISTFELFERKDIQGRLLILGEPGAGKTTELLSLAKRLLQEAKQDPEGKIPVIFELSEWSDKNDFAEWLSLQLIEKHNVPMTVSQQWIRQEKLLPLLDGLDELRRVDTDELGTSEEIDKGRKAKQIRCIRAINMFLQKHTVPLVVCCRHKEYEILESKAEYLKYLNGAIYLQELSDAQIREYLIESKKPHIWQILKTQSEMLTLVRSPLFLLMLVVAYNGKHVCNSKELIDAYINAQLNDDNNKGTYPPGKDISSNQVRFYLGWLANKLEKAGTTEFLIERLQPSWIEDRFTRDLYRGMLALCTWLIFISLCIPFGSVMDDIKSNLLVVAVVGTFFFSFFLLLFSLGKENEKGEIEIEDFLLRDIQPKETIPNYNSIWEYLLSFFQVFSGSVSRKDFIRYLLCFLLLPPIFAFVIILLQNFLSYADPNPFRPPPIPFIEFPYIIIRVQLGYLLVGMFPLVMMLFAYPLSFGLTAREVDILNKRKPNQGVIASAKNGLAGGLGAPIFYGVSLGLCYLSYILLYYYADKWFPELSPPEIPDIKWHVMILLSYCGVVGLVNGLWVALKHAILRIILYHSGVSPWDYRKFLEHAEKYRFIQSVGGRYRFAHDLLRKYFVEQYKPHR